MGRRWGKSITAGTIVLNVLRQHGRSAWVVPEYKNGRALWRFISDRCAHLAQSKILSISKTERVITTHRGGFFGMYSGDNIDSIRSEWFHLVVNDEAARLDESGRQDAIIPTLADADGDLIDISTPIGKNWFYNEFQMGRSMMNEERAAWTAPTSANPSPNIQKAFRRIKEQSETGWYSKRSFKQEWLAEFVQDGALFVNVEACATAVPTPPIDGRHYVIGVDWARSSGGDYTVFAVVDAQTRSLAHLTRLSGQAFDVQLDRLRELWQNYNQAHIVAEYNSMGAPLVERLQMDGLPVTGFVTTASSKHTIITALELAFDRQEIAVLSDPALLVELNAFERKERAGLPSYSAPSGQHDDTVIALALAWHGVAAGTLEVF